MSTEHPDTVSDTAPSGTESKPSLELNTSDSPLATTGTETDDSWFTPGETVRPHAEQQSLINCFVTVNGGENLADAVQHAGAEIGVETSHEPPNEYSVEFCDFPFTADDMTVEDHIDRVKELQPRVAVAPDIDDRDPQEVYAVADRLRSITSVETVIVIPKTVHPSDVPDRFRVGVPLANFGGSTDDSWPVTEYQNCRSLHLLGGSPSKQLDFAKNVGIDRVDSLDGASILKAGQFGDYWHPTIASKWTETGEEVSYYDRVMASLINLQRAWTSESNSEPSDFLEQDETVVLSEQRDAAVKASSDIETEYRYHASGARGATRTIHPRDTDCLKPSEQPANNPNLEAVNWQAEHDEAVQNAVEEHEPVQQQTGIADF